MIKHKKIFKKIGMAIVIFLLIAILLLLGLRTSIVQNFIADRILSSLSKSLDTEVSIKDIKVNFFDEATISGLYIKDSKKDTLIYADNIHLDVSLFSFFKKQLTIDEVTLNDAIIKITDDGNGIYNSSFLFADQESPTQETNPTQPWKINIDKATINNLTGQYTSTSQHIYFWEKLLELDFNAFNLEDNIYELAYLSLDDGRIMHHKIPGLNIDTDSSGFVLPDIGVRVNSDNIHFSDQSLIMINGEDSTTFSNVQFETEDFQWNKNHLSTSISSFSLESELGINLQELDGKVGIDSNQLILEKLHFKSNRDELFFSGTLLLDHSISGVLNDLKAEISAQTLLLIAPLLPEDIAIQRGFPASLSANEVAFSKNNVTAKNLNFTYGNKLQLKGNYSLKNFSQIDQLVIVADIKALKIDQPQIRKIFPSIAIPDSLKRYTTITLTGLANGPINDLKFSKIKANLDNQVTASLSGSLKNLLTPDSMEYNLLFDEIRADIKYLPLPKINVLALDSLGKVNFGGRLAGSMTSLSVDGLFDSYLGSIRMNSKIDLADNIDDTVYKGSFDLKSFDLGTFLIRDDIGVVTLSTELSGQGFNLSTLNSNIKGRIDEFSYNGYNYRNVILNAIYKDCLLDGNLSIDDENVKLSYTGKIDLTSDKIQVNFKADIDTINFAPLNLLDTQMGMKADVHADFQLPLSTDKKGIIAFYELKMNQGDMRYEDDSLLINLNRINQNTEIDISSNFLTGHIDGDFRIKELPLALSEIIKVYTGNQDTLLTTSELKSKNIHFKGNLQSLDPVNNFISDHDIFLASGRIDLEIDLTSFRISSNSRLDSLIFDGNLVEIAQLRTSEEMDVPNLQIEGYNINTVGNISFPYLYINSALDNNTILADISIEDEDNIPKLKVGTKWIQEASGDLSLVLNDSLILNNASWNITKDNRITFGQAINIKNLRIFDDDESMTIMSSDSSGQNLNIDLDNFNIRQFITLLTSDPIDMGGAMNGNIELKDLSEDFYFLMNVTLNDIVYNSKPVGSILLTANDDPKTGIISGTFDLIGSENDIIGNGTFDPNTRQLNWDIFMGLLEMRLLDPFLDEIISESKGIMFGELRLTGTLEKPNIFGELSFENISTNVDLNNTRYDIPSHKITFSNKKIDIGQLTVNDQEGNTALVTGAINHNFYNDFELDLDINTDQFVFLNTTSRINPIFYGKIILDADINLTGPPDLVEVNANARAIKNSTLTISPFSQTESILKEEFIRYGKPEDYENQSTRYLQQIARLYPYVVNINLDVDENADFTFVVDPLSGDKLNCKGVGSLRVNLSPNGQQEIYGNYQVSSGEYSFSYGDFVNRRFNIQPGGIIRFNGNPLDAVLDVKAVYTAYTSPYELIKNEVTLSESEINTARRRTNVEVLLSLSGSLLSPEINLDLRVPELQAGNVVAVVDRKINSLRNNPDDLNNQVFALLVLNQFLSTETTSSGFDKVGQNLALSSISNLISSELNRLAKNVIKGVDVNIDVNSYNSQYLRESGSATVTEIGLSVSKQLFNDRISVSAGGNLNIDDYSLAEGSFASFVGDFVLEYRLTESGNYKLRVFSKRDYDRLLNENTSRNGVSLFFSKEFDEKTAKK